MRGSNYVGTFQWICMVIRTLQHWLGAPVEGRKVFTLNERLTFMGYAHGSDYVVPWLTKYKQFDITTVQALLRSALAADAVLNTVSGPERRQVRQDSECLAAFLRSGEDQGNCRPLQIYGRAGRPGNPARISPHHPATTPE
jgi:hypothetical protein